MGSFPKGLEVSLGVNVSAGESGQVGAGWWVPKRRARPGVEARTSHLSHPKRESYPLTNEPGCAAGTQPRSCPPRPRAPHRPSRAQRRWGLPQGAALSLPSARRPSFPPAPPTMHRAMMQSHSASQQSSPHSPPCSPRRLFPHLSRVCKTCKTPREPVPLLLWGHHSPILGHCGAACAPLAPPAQPVLAAPICPGKRGSLRGVRCIPAHPLSPALLPRGWRQALSPKPTARGPCSALPPPAPQSPAQGGGARAAAHPGSLV